MATTGVQELILAVRNVLMQDAAMKKAGIFYDRAPQQDKLPYVLFSITPMPLNRRFGGGAIRLYRVMVKACASDVGNKSALVIAQPMADRALQLLTETIDGELPAARLSATLNPSGWRALVPLEAMPLEPYSDRVAETERWFFGGMFDLRIEQL